MVDKIKFSKMNDEMRPSIAMVTPTLSWPENS